MHAMCAQAFLVDILEEKDYLNNRRKMLRQRAGLSDRDTKKAPLGRWMGLVQI